MSLFQKIKIKIRPKAGIAPAARVEVREKLTYACSVCHNSYYDHHLYCPQCLGEVLPSHARSSLLRIQSIPETRRMEVAEVLATLSEARDFAFQKAFDNLPWILMQNSEECIVLHWKEVLDAFSVQSEIAPFDAAAKQGRRKKPPLFEAKAPAPAFLSRITDAGTRQMAKSLKDATLRLQWVECVLSGVRIIEDFYKHHPSERVVFSEFLFHIDQELKEAVKDYESMYKNLPGLPERIQRIRARFESMSQEIHEVRKNVEDRL